LTFCGNFSIVCFICTGVVSQHKVQRMRFSLRVSVLVCSLLLVSDASSSNFSAAPEPAGSSSSPSVIVIGFVGGYVRHDDPVHTEVQLAGRLREEYASALSVQTFENHRGEDAHHAVL